MEHKILTARCVDLFEKFFSPPVHAYMLCADKFAGKADIALYVAKRLLCSSAIAPCGACPSCTMLSTSKEHPCLTIISRANGKSSIPVEDIRAIRNGIFDAPYLSKYKIFIIEEAERMTQSAQNALRIVLHKYLYIKKYVKQEILTITNIISPFLLLD